MDKRGETGTKSPDSGADIQGLASEATKVDPDVRMAPGERRRVAILFVELQDLYSWSEVLKHDELNRVLDRIYTVFSGIVASFGGYVARTEEGILMALFGNRSASEMDGQRAVRASLGMFEKLHQINRYLSNRQIQLDIKAGVHIGMVAVDALGQLKGGDAVSIAASLKSAAAVNTVLVSQSTREELGDVFIFEHLGNIHLQAQADPVEVQRVVGINPRGKGRWNRSSLVRRSHFVGRARILNRLEAAYANCLNPDSWRYQSEPYATRRRWVLPTFIGLRGAAGSGKSRIIYEFRRREGRGLDSATPCLAGRADPLAHVPYGLFVDLLRDITGIQGEDSTPVRRRKLQALTRPLSLTDPTLKAYVPVIGHVLGIRYDDPQLEEAGPQSLQAEIHIALTALLRAMATHVYKQFELPLIIQLFDIHAADERSEAALLAILERLRSSVPLLIIATYREGYRPPREVGLSSRFSQYSLGPLRRQDVSTLVASMLDGFTLPEGLLRRLSQLSGGNPYFVEELVRNMVQDGVLQKGEEGWSLVQPEAEITFPQSLGGLILARIDTLPKAVRDTLIYASAIGAVFSQDLLKAVAKRLGSSSIEPHLKVLSEERHIRPIPAAREASFSFPNLLSREAVYSTLLPENRKVLHRVVGESILKLYQGNLTQHYGNLGRHFRLAGMEVQSRRFYGLAVEVAQRENSHDLVLAHCKHLLRLGSSGELGWVRLAMARAQRAMGKLRGASDTLDEAIRGARSSDDGSNAPLPFIALTPDELPGQKVEHQGLLIDLLLEQGAVQLHLGQRRWSLELSDEAMKGAIALEDGRREIEARVLRVRALGLMGRFEEARKEIDAIGKSERRGAGRGRSSGRLPSLLGRLALHEGRLEEAQAHFEEALRSHVNTGNITARFEDLCDLVEVLLRGDRIKEAQGRVDEVLTLSDEVHGGISRQGRMLRGALEAALGGESGGAQLARALEEAEGAGDLTSQARGHRLIAADLARRGEHVEADAHRRRAAGLWEV